MAKWAKLACLLLLVTGSLAPSAVHGEALGVFFFDYGYGVNDCEVGVRVPLVPFDVYFSLIDVEGPVLGFEFSYTLTPSPSLLRVSADIPGGPSIDIGDSSDPFNGYYMCGLVQPRVAAPVITLVHWQMMEMASPGTVVTFFLGPIRFASLPGGYPVVEGGEGYGLRLVDVNSQWDPPIGPVAVINECLGTPVETSSFGAVKSLFR